MPKAPKKKAAPKASKPKAPASYSVAKCGKCGMQWKHHGPDAPLPFCQGCVPDAPAA
jgi:hypothetical protein